MNSPADDPPDRFAGCARWLWRPSNHQLIYELSLPPQETVARITAGLATVQSDPPEVLGTVQARRIQLWRNRQSSRILGSFAPLFIGTVEASESGSLLIGHFQLSPTTRLFLATWLTGTTLIALAVLAAGLLQETPESRALDALPLLLPALLPLMGWALLFWSQRQGAIDQAVIRAWTKRLFDDVLVASPHYRANSF